MNGFIPIAKKKLSRGAKSSTARPASTPLAMYSMPSASVYASSRSRVAPASCMWYPLMEIELKRGMRCDVNRNTSATISIEGAGG